MEKFLIPTFCFSVIGCPKQVKSQIFFEIHGNFLHVKKAHIFIFWYYFFKEHNVQTHCNTDGAFLGLIIQLEFFVLTGIHTQESHTWQESGNDLRMPPTEESKAISLWELRILRKPTLTILCSFSWHIIFLDPCFVHYANLNFLAGCLIHTDHLNAYLVCNLFAMVHF